jgi:hypothetical protein
MPKQDPDVLEKWKKAVVHLEGASDSIGLSERADRWRKLAERLEKGEIAFEEMVRLERNDSMKGSRDVRFQGTATFLEYDTQHFLLTARHVLFDELGAKHRLLEMEKFFSTWPPWQREGLMAEEREQVLDTIFGIIFIVPSYDEIVEGKPLSPERFLMNLGAGVSWAWPYTFSDPSIDLAIISLTRRNKSVAEQLLARGYRPVALNDIADGPSAEGADIFSVGYPEHMSVVGNRLLQPAEQQWASEYVSLPSFIFGRVSMANGRLPFFWCDFGPYPGQSGSPVVEDGKMVGVISGQGTSHDDVWMINRNPDTMSEHPFLNTDYVAETRIPFGLAFRAGLLRGLLDIQTQKSRNRNSLTQPRL